MNDDDLRSLEAVFAAPRDIPLAEAIFQNLTPPGWQARIVGVSARFIYKDATGRKIDEELITRQVQVYANGQTSIFGTKRLCAMSIDQAMTVAIDGTLQNLGPQLNNADPDKCLMRVSMAVVPARKLSTDTVATPQSIAQVMIE